MTRDKHALDGSVNDKVYLEACQSWACTAENEILHTRFVMVAVWMYKASRHVYWELQEM